MKKVFSLFAALLLFSNIYSQEVTFWSDIPNDELATLITDQMTNTELYSQILMFGWAGAEPEEILYQWVKRGLGSVSFWLEYRRHSSCGKINYKSSKKFP